MSVPHRTPEERAAKFIDDLSAWWTANSANPAAAFPPTRLLLENELRAAESEARSAAEEELKRLRVLENQVNWFDASTHHGEWDEADIETVREVIPPIGGSEPIDVHHVKPTAICRLCGHTPIEHYAARESEAFRRGYEKAREELSGLVTLARNHVRELGCGPDPLACKPEIGWTCGNHALIRALEPS